MLIYDSATGVVRDPSMHVYAHSRLTLRHVIRHNRHLSWKCYHVPSPNVQSVLQPRNCNTLRSYGKCDWGFSFCLRTCQYRSKQSLHQTQQSPPDTGIRSPIDLIGEGLSEMTVTFMCIHTSRLLREFSSDQRGVLAGKPITLKNNPRSTRIPAIAWIPSPLSHK